MQTSISFSVGKGAKILVKEGERVEKGTPLFELGEFVEKKALNLAEILKIKKERINKFLTKKIGEKIKKGEVIAEKRSFLGKFLVKSPYQGRISSINLKTGEVFIEEKFQKRKKVNTPVSGKIKRADGKIEVLFKGEVFFGKSGYGKGEGRLLKIGGEKIGVLEIPADILGKVLLGKKFLKDAFAKIKVLGGNGIVALALPEAIDLPFLLVKEKDYEKIEKLEGKKTILDGKEKKLIVVLE